MHKSGVGSMSLVSSRSKETLNYMLKICFCRFTFRENLRATESSKSKSLEGPKAKNSLSPSHDREGWKGRRWFNQSPSSVIVDFHVSD